MPGLDRAGGERGEGRHGAADATVLEHAPRLLDRRRQEAVRRAARPQPAPLRLGKHGAALRRRRCQRLLGVHVLARPEHVERDGGVGQRRGEIDAELDARVRQRLGRRDRAGDPELSGAGARPGEVEVGARRHLDDPGMTGELGQVLAGDVAAADERDADGGQMRHHEERDPSAILRPWSDG
jgi:hypothetical protein